MNTCKTCSYFRRGGKLEWQNGLFGNLQKIEGEIMSHNQRGNVVLTLDILSKIGMCLNKKIQSDVTCDWLSRSEEGEIVDGIISTCDEQRAELIVGEDFGCIHWIKRETVSNG